MEAWMEYNQGRLPYPGSVSEQDHIVLRSLQLMTTAKNRIENERLEKQRKKSKSTQITMEAKKHARRGTIGLPPGVSVSGGQE